MARRPSQIVTKTAEVAGFVCRRYIVLTS